ncbi:ASCH domain-containing protein [Nocardia nova]|uniref:ASCH domain-containing protein n=1 Tax=Nocardia nova TaxID=37330 RepID=UPI000CEA373D|nr:ASCH domain-containing protein [Nocardia nova]PPI89218.1 hypothetical protein C5E46_34420 [Nocardia nova]
MNRSDWVPATEWERRKAAGRAAERNKPERARRVLDGQCRALSVRRPWANLIIAGHKSVENRSWGTDHRGRLVIHAGKTWVPEGAALAAAEGLDGFGDRAGCPAGILGVVRLIDVHPAAGCCAPWGFQEPGTWHWVLADPKPLPEPVPAPGRLGLYWVPGDLIAGVA